MLPEVWLCPSVLKSSGYMSAPFHHHVSETGKDEIQHQRHGQDLSSASGILFSVQSYSHAYIWSINNRSISRWCAVTAGCRVCAVWCSEVKPPNQQSSSEHAVPFWMSLPSCLWMLPQHAETRGRCSNGIANDIAASPENLPVSLSSSPPHYFHTSFTAFLITPSPYLHALL